MCRCHPRYPEPLARVTRSACVPGKRLAARIDRAHEAITDWPLRCWTEEQNRKPLAPTGRALWTRLLHLQQEQQNGMGGNRRSTVRKQQQYATQWLRQWRRRMHGHRARFKVGPGLSVLEARRKVRRCTLLGRPEGILKLYDVCKIFSLGRKMFAGTLTFAARVLRPLSRRKMSAACKNG